MIVEQVINCDTFGSISSLLGNKGSEVLTNVINNYCELGGGGTRFAQNANQEVLTHLNMFYERVIEPERKVNLQIAEALGTFRLDGIKYITNISELETGIPVSMQEAILSYEPVRKLFIDGKISGFSWKIEDLPIEDRWGRLCNNGRIEDLSEYKEGDEVRYEWEHHKDDPTPSYEELRAIRYTREYIDEFLEKTNYDITCYPNKIGKLKNKK